MDSDFHKLDESWIKLESWMKCSVGVEFSRTRAIHVCSWRSETYISDNCRILFVYGKG